MATIHAATKAFRDTFRHAPRSGGSLVAGPAAPTLGPWCPIGEGLAFRVDARVELLPETDLTRTPCAVSLDPSPDGGETFTTTTPIPTGLAEGTSYQVPYELSPADGTHFRVRVGGNVAVGVALGHVIAFGDVTT